jgi:rhamnosyl/mannosyltransferase
MKILHFYKNYVHDSQGGLEQAIYQICRGTKSMGAENRVLTLGNDSRCHTLEREEATVFSCPCSMEIASCGLSWAAAKNLREQARWADIIHYHFPWPFADLLHVLGRFKNPCLVTYHSDIIRQKALDFLYSPLKHMFLSSMGRIVSTSENYVHSSPVLKRYKDKVSVIPLGLDPRTYPEVDEQNVRKWKARLGRDFFLFVGVMRYYKGLDFLLDAAKMSNEHFVIVGAGPREKELHAKADSLGLSNVHFLGHIRDGDKVALLSLCSGLVFPSHLRSEAFGLSLLEGAMYGRPLISAEIDTGTSFINKDGVTGIVVPKSDPQALSRAVETLAHNPALAQEMGNNARNRFEQLFTAQRQAEEYMGQYQHLVSAKKNEHDQCSS